MTTNRVLRGGSWCFAELRGRCASRSVLDPGRHGANIGLRPVAKALPPNRERVLRGGSWFTTKQNVRSAIRHAVSPRTHYMDYSFRPVAKEKP
jgi:formylglycine-generating enzyme required for sulfatase activity